MRLVQFSRRTSFHLIATVIAVQGDMFREVMFRLEQRRIFYDAVYSFESHVDWFIQQGVALEYLIAAHIALCHECEQRIGHGLIRRSKGCE